MSSRSAACVIGAKVVFGVVFAECGPAIQTSYYRVVGQFGLACDAVSIDLVFEDVLTNDPSDFPMLRVERVTTTLGWLGDLELCVGMLQGVPDGRPWVKCSC